MIRVIIDTGVVVSAAFRDRTPEEIILFVVGEEDFDWIVSPAILGEYNRVLTRKKFDLPQSVITNWRNIFERCTSLVEVDIEIEFDRDQKDALFLNCALAAEADYLITGDRDFEEARKLINTSIISISQFKQLIMKNWQDS